jgi:hypothetical protein
MTRYYPFSTLRASCEAEKDKQTDANRDSTRRR